jgi:hypothetical protein
MAPCPCPVLLYSRCPCVGAPTYFVKGLITLAFWMCSKTSAAMTSVFDVQQKLWPISIAQHRAARRTACRAACCVACVFNVVFFFHPLSDLGTLKRTQRCMQRNVAFMQHDVALHGLLRGLLQCNVNCIQCSWPQVLLQIENASHADDPNCTFKTQV